MNRAKILLIALWMILSATTGRATISIPAEGVTHGLGSGPSGLDFSGVSVAGAAGDLTTLGTGSKGIDNATTGVSATLAFPVPATTWSGPLVLESMPTSALTSLSNDVRLVLHNSSGMLTGPTGNRYHALVGSYRNDTGTTLSSLYIGWVNGVSIAPAGTGSPAVDPLAGIHLYISRTGQVNSWFRLGGPWHTNSDLSLSTVPLPFGTLVNGATFFLAWVDDNGPGGASTTNPEGNFLIRMFTVAPPLTIRLEVVDPRRSDNGTPRNPGDDLLSFDVYALGMAPFSSGMWRVDMPGTSIDGQTGRFPGWTTFSNLPVTLLDPVTHRLNLFIRAVDAPTVTATASVTFPWCQIGATLLGTDYHDGGTPLDLADDTVDVRLTAEGEYTGSQFSVLGHAANYGAPVTLTGHAPGSLVNLSVTDSADPSCQATLALRLPRVLGGGQVAGVRLPLLTQTIVNPGAGAGWIWNAIDKSMNLTNSGNSPAEFSTAPVSLAGIQTPVRVDFELSVVDQGPGFEASDFLWCSAECDGKTFSLIPRARRDGFASDLDHDNSLAGFELSLPGSHTVESPGVTVHSFSLTLPGMPSIFSLRFRGASTTAAKLLKIRSMTVYDSTDTDGDGIPDDYELAHGLDADDGGDKYDDRDGDGQSNYSEYFSRTSASDRASSLAIIHFGRFNNGSTFQVIWSSVAFMTYHVELAGSPAGPWTTFNTWPYVDPSGDVTTTQYAGITNLSGPVPPALADRFFLRVVPVSPP